MVHLGVALTMGPTGGQRPPQPPHQSSTGCQRDGEVYTGGLGEALSTAAILNVCRVVGNYTNWEVAKKYTHPQVILD